jgi:hypothetical protein
MINAGNVDVLNENGFEFIIGMKLWAMKEAEQKKIEALERNKGVKALLYSGFDIAPSS